MKKSIFIFLTLFIGLQAAAQAFYRDVVHLKNGSVIKGKIVEEVPNKTYTIAFSAGYAWDASHGFDDAGFLFNPQIGLQINKSSDMMFHIGFGYEMQQMEFPNMQQLGGVIMRFSEALSINAGVVF